MSIISLKHIPYVSYLFTSGFKRLQKNAHTFTIWCTHDLIFKGIVPLKVRKFFSLSITRSTWIRCFAILLVFLTSFSFSRFPSPHLHLVVNGGILTVAFLVNDETTTLLNVIMLFLWPLVNGELLFSVVYVLDPIVEDSDALLTVIRNVDLVSRVRSFSVRIEGVAFCLAGTAAVIPKR